MIPLKPCPFCGSDMVTSVTRPDVSYLTFVYCHNHDCAAVFSFRHKKLLNQDEVAQKFNRRATGPSS